MFTILTCIRDQHDLKLVLLAALVCVGAAVTALRFHRAVSANAGSTRTAFILGTALVAGGGVWATHFIAMLAYSVDLPMAFDIGVTIGSLAVAVIGMGLGFLVAEPRASNLRLLAGGLITGLAIAAMHFTGIAAIRSAFGIAWDHGFVAAAILAACAGSTGAMFANKRFGGWRGWVLPALLLVLGIVGLHFTAMAAIRVIPDLSAAPVDAAIHRAGVAVLTGAMALVMIAASAAMTAVQGWSRRSTARSLEAAFGGLPLGMAMFNPLGQLTLWNAAFERLLGHLEVTPQKGMTRHDLLAQELSRYDGAPPQEISDWIEAIRSGRKSGIAREWPAGDGTWLRMELCALPGGDSVTVITDITQAREHAAAMTEAKERAEAASRAKSEFLANMSHEIRTPLNGILGMVQVMGQGDMPAPQRERLKVIRESGATLLSILNDLLDLSKIEAGKLQIEPADVDVAAVVRSVAATFEGIALTKDLRLEVALDAELDGWWRVDGDRLRQVLGNLVGNALKFTHEGGVRIEAGCADGRLVFAVQDSGIGIAAADLPTLFDKFTQADASTTRRYGGTGLGLSICKALADAMGADLTVQSEPGRGTRFDLVLPAGRAASQPAQAPASTRPGEAASGRLRILAAEDNPTNQLVLRALLEPVDCELVLVEDGAKAVAAAASQRFDIILMDIQMPVMNGVEAMRAIRAAEREGRTPRTPILALTANVMQSQIADYVAAGADGWVAKPVETAKLFAALSEALESAQAAAAAA